MSRKSNRWFWAFLGILIFYIFLFPSPLGKELLVKRRWSTRLDRDMSSEQPSTSDHPVFGYKFGQRLGYISEEGDLIYTEDIPFNAAVSDTVFSNYSSVPGSLFSDEVPNTLFFHTPNGRMLMNIQQAGYPYIQDERIFIINTNRSGLSEWSRSGELIWERTFSSVVTDIAVSESFLVVTLLEGDAVLIGNEGQKGEVLTPGGSRLPVLYGSAVSPDEEYIALVSGLDPQRLILYQKKKEGYKPVFHYTLQSDFRRRVGITFTADGRHLLYEGADGIEGLNILSRRRLALRLPGRTRTLLPVFHDAASVITAEQGKLRLTAFLAPDNIFLSTAFPGERAFLRQSGSGVFLGVDDTMMRIDFVEG